MRPEIEERRGEGPPVEEARPPVPPAAPPERSEGARLGPPIVLALLLIGAGVLLLLRNLGLLIVGWGLLWSLIFAVGGLALLSSYVSNRASWWALIPGFVLLGLGLVVALAEFAPGLNVRWGGPLFLSALALGFWAIYLDDRARWWAIIPAGVLTTLAVVAALPGRPEGGSLFFLGLGLTFALIYLAPAPRGRMEWALWPAVVSFVLAAVVAFGAGAVFGWLWAVLLILAGLYLIVRQTRGLPP